MRSTKLFAYGMLAIATTTAATSPPAVDTLETIKRNPNLTEFRAVLGEQSFVPNARISIVAPINGSCDSGVLRGLATGSVGARKAFIEAHAMQGFIYTNGYDLQPNGRPVSVTWGTTDHQLHRIGEGERLTVPTLAGGNVTVEITAGQVFIGHQLIARGGVDVAMNGSVIEIHGCGPLD